MDILVPQPFKGRPLVVYVTGGGFSQAPKEAALNLRTYVAEAGSWSLALSIGRTVTALRIWMVSPM